MLEAILEKNMSTKQIHQGIILLKNTKFNKLDYIETLRLMEKYDTIKPNTISKDIYKKLYNIENQIFN